MTQLSSNFERNLSSFTTPSLVPPFNSSISRESYLRNNYNTNGTFGFQPYFPPPIVNTQKGESDVELNTVFPYLPPIISPPLDEYNDRMVSSYLPLPPLLVPGECNRNFFRPFRENNSFIDNYQGQYSISENGNNKEEDTMNNNSIYIENNDSLYEEYSFETHSSFFRFNTNGANSSNIQNLPSINVFFLSIYGGASPVSPNFQDDFDEYTNSEDEDYEFINEYTPNNCVTEDIIKSLASILINENHVKDKEECTICMDKYNLDERVTQLPCSHIYHENCISTWLKSNNTCPICRFILVNVVNQNITNQQNDTKEDIDMDTDDDIYSLIMNTVYDEDSDLDYSHDEDIENELSVDNDYVNIEDSDD